MNLENIKIGVRAIILNDKKVLMVKHLENDKEFYVFPGGGLEIGESVMSAVEREVLEETQIEVKADRIIYVREFVGREDYGVEFYILCNTVGDANVKLGTDPEKDVNNKVLIAVEWIKIDKLSEITWYPLELNNKFKNDVVNGFQEFSHLGKVEIK